MKRFMTLLMVLVFASTSMAATNPQTPPPAQKSMLESIIEAMAKQYAESYAKDLVIEQIEKYAAKVVGDQVLGSISYGLTVIGLIENVRSYDDASSESQRYSAFAHGVANAVTLIVPGAGAIVQMSVLGQGLAAAYVSKDYQLKLAQTVAEIARLEKLTSDLMLAEFDQEKNAIIKLAARLESIEVLMKTTWDGMQIECARDGSDLIDPKKCLQHVLLYQQLLTKQVQTAQAYLNFRGRFLNVNNLLSAEDLKKMKEGIQETRNKLKGNQAVASNVLAEYSISKMAMIRGEVDKNLISQRCEILLLESVSKLIQIKKWMMESASEDWMSFAMDEEKINLNTLATGVCAESSVPVSGDLGELVRDQLQ